MEQDGCTTIYILNDKEVYGAGLARNIESSAKEQGLEVAGNEGIDPKAPELPFAGLRRSRAPAPTASCSPAPRRTGRCSSSRTSSAALPDARLYGPDGVSNPEFFVADEGGIPAEVADKVKVTVATLSPEEYPPEGQRFFDEYKKRYNVPAVDPYAIYGYEAMQLVLDTCEQLGAGCSDRQAMIDALMSTKGRGSVLGTYDIDENGDTTLTDYGVYTVKDGELVFDETVKAAQ